MEINEDSLNILKMILIIIFIIVSFYSLAENAIWAIRDILVYGYGLLGVYFIIKTLLYKKKKNIYYKKYLKLAIIFFSICILLSILFILFWFYLVKSISFV